MVATAGLLALAAHPGTAREIQLGAETQYVHNSNFFSSDDNEEDANSFQIGPIIDLRDRDGRFLYSVNFTGGYQAYVDQDDVDAWESRLRGQFDYILTPRTTIRLNENFRDISNLRFSRQDIAVGDTAIDPNQDRYFRNDLELELLHELTRSLEMRVAAAHHWIDFNRNIDRNDSQSWEVASELRYRIAPAHRVGVEANYVDQNFEDALSRIGSRGQYLTTALNWIWDISSTVQFRANGGPAWIRSVEDRQITVEQTQFVGGRVNGDPFRANFATCETSPGSGTFLASDCDLATEGVPNIPGGTGAGQVFALEDRGRVGRDTDVTFFGGASLVGNIEDWTISASYSRRQSTGGGDGLASSLDRVGIDLEWHPERFVWSTFVAGSWDRRETLTRATEVDFEVIAGPNGEAQRDVAFTQVRSGRERRDNYTAIVGLRGAVNRNLNGTFEFRYRRFETNDRVRDIPGVDLFFAVLTLRYQLDPIRF